MPSPEPYLTVRAIRPLVSGLRVLGYEPESIFASAAITAATLEEPDARVPMSLGVNLLNRAAVVTRDEDIGLHLAEHADLGTCDVHFYAMLVLKRELGGAHTGSHKGQDLMVRDATVQR